MDECTFCQIVAGRLPSFRVLQDEHTLAFLDIRPASRGHTLVVPREHARDIWAISDTTHGRSVPDIHPVDPESRRVAQMVHRVCALMKTGGAAGQEVFHFHTHVIPRWHGDHLPVMRGPALASRGQLEDVLAVIDSVR